MASQLEVNIPVKQLKQRICTCGGTVFVQMLSLREVPAIYSPTGNPDTWEELIGYVCSACGEVISPVQERPEQERKILALG